MTRKTSLCAQYKWKSFCFLFLVGCIHGCGAHRPGEWTVQCCLSSGSSSYSFQGKGSLTSEKPCHVNDVHVRSSVNPLMAVECRLVVEFFATLSTFVGFFS